MVYRHTRNQKNVIEGLLAAVVCRDTLYSRLGGPTEMKPSKQIELLISKLNQFADEPFNGEIQDHMQAAYEHLEEVQLDLEEAGL